MSHTIDHVVIVVRDLARAVADYASAGFTVTPGGAHADGTTHNALITFADGAYLELIAFKEPDRSQPHQWWPRLARGEGLTHYALRADDLAADVARLRALGVAVSDPRDGGRVRPDGQELRWRTATLEGGGFALPFLIEDVTPRELRVPGGATAEHALGVMGVAGLRVLADDPNAVAAALAALFRSPRPHVSPMPTDDGILHRLDTGAQWIELLHPGDASSELADALVRFGPGPYELVLTGDPAADHAGHAVLLPGELHGARIGVEA